MDDFYIENLGYDSYSNNERDTGSDVVLNCKYLLNLKMAKNEVVL